jgi:protein-tyrosine-phosphatase
MAEGYFKYLVEQSGRSDIAVSSSGIHATNGAPISSYVLSVLEPYPVDMQNFRSQKTTKQLIEKSDIIIVMEHSHKMGIGQLDVKAIRKTYLMLDLLKRESTDVADPYGGDLGVYGGCFDEMKPALENLFNNIENYIND